jgi:hypothetical protein
MDDAAARGHLETAKWFHANTNAECTVAAMGKAARGGHLLKWLYDNTLKGCTLKVITNALRSRHFGAASWLYEQFPEYLPGKLNVFVTGCR